MQCVRYTKAKKGNALFLFVKTSDKESGQTCGKNDKRFCIFTALISSCDVVEQMKEMA
jgi:hypothetical protein